MNPMLSVSPEQYDEKLGFLDALGFGGEMVLLGMCAVFLVLSLIWAILVVFKIVFTKIEKKEKAPALAEEPAPQVAVSNFKDGEVVAAIAAAIAVAESESDNTVKFKVVSFKRK